MCSPCRLVAAVGKRPVSEGLAALVEIEEIGHVLIGDQSLPELILGMSTMRLLTHTQHGRNIGPTCSELHFPASARASHCSIGQSERGLSLIERSCPASRSCMFALRFAHPTCSPPTFTVPLTDTPDLTEIGSVGRCAADRVASIATDDQV